MCKIYISRDGQQQKGMIRKKDGQTMTGRIIHAFEEIQCFLPQQNCFQLKGCKTRSIQLQKRGNFSLNAFLLHLVKRTKFDIIMSLTFIQLDANHKRLKPFLRVQKKLETC